MPGSSLAFQSLGSDAITEEKLRQMSSRRAHRCRVYELVLTPVVWLVTE